MLIPPQAAPVMRESLPNLLMPGPGFLPGQPTIQKPPNSLLPGPDAHPGSPMAVAPPSELDPISPGLPIVRAERVEQEDDTKEQKHLGIQRQPGMFSTLHEGETEHFEFHNGNKRSAPEDDDDFLWDPSNDSRDV